MIPKLFVLLAVPLICRGQVLPDVPDPKLTLDDLKDIPGAEVKPAAADPEMSIVVTKELEAVMKKYSITEQDLQKMLEDYANGLAPEINKTIVNPETGMEENIQLNFENFVRQNDVNTQRTSITPPADPLPEPINTAVGPDPNTAVGPDPIPADSPLISKDSSRPQIQPPTPDDYLSLQERKQQLERGLAELEMNRIGNIRSHSQGLITRDFMVSNIRDIMRQKAILEAERNDIQTLLRTLYPNRPPNMPQARREPQREVVLGRQTDKADDSNSIEEEIRKIRRENEQLARQLAALNQPGRRGRRPSRTSPPRRRPPVISERQRRALLREHAMIERRIREIRQLLEWYRGRRPPTQLPIAFDPVTGLERIRAFNPIRRRRINLTGIPRRRPVRTLTGSVGPILPLRNTI